MKNGEYQAEPSCKVAARRQIEGLAVRACRLTSSGSSSEEDSESLCAAREARESVLSSRRRRADGLYRQHSLFEVSVP